jgi:hypothetical protein
MAECQKTIKLTRKEAEFLFALGCDAFSVKYYYIDDPVDYENLKEKYKFSMILRYGDEYAEGVKKARSFKALKALMREDEIKKSKEALTSILKKEIDYINSL